jgi:catechol 2,3-dioxygenase-like lactoylglutathione lyase family enzyme
MTTPPLVHHIGILVADLEAAIARWTEVTGYEFSPIARYKTPCYADQSDPEPHPHDARISFSMQGTPYIELMEFHGEGTHAPAQGEGFHHLGFLDYPDTMGRLDEVHALGMRDDGRSIDADGKVILWFTDKRDLNNIRLEYVSTDIQPTVRDDGAPLDIGEDGKPSLWPVG